MNVITSILYDKLAMAHGKISHNPRSFMKNKR